MKHKLLMMFALLFVSVAVIAVAKKNNVSNNAKKFVPKVETSSEICRNCNGSGRVACYICKGAGVKKCSGCQGKGYHNTVNPKKPRVTCGVCNGGGMVKCGTCYGKGTQTCNRCYGKGRR